MNIHTTDVLPKNNGKKVYKMRSALSKVVLLHCPGLRNQTPGKRPYLKGVDVATNGVTGPMVSAPLIAGTINPCIDRHLLLCG